jgi:hypothetical protein
LQSGWLDVMPLPELQSGIELSVNRGSTRADVRSGVTAFKEN